VIVYPGGRLREESGRLSLAQKQIVKEFFVDHAHALRGIVVQSRAAQTAIDMQRVEMMLKKSFEVLHAVFGLWVKDF